ncbi:MAG: hypothetical protein ACYDA6_05535 [Solirubrobacteraceae bacterium]
MRTKTSSSFSLPHREAERRHGPRRAAGRRRGEQAHAGFEPATENGSEHAGATSLDPVGIEAASRHARATYEESLDMARYTCQCGLIFSAAVSTTVSCPHCGTEQAW